MGISRRSVIKSITATSAVAGISSCGNLETSQNSISAHRVVSEDSLPMPAEPDGLLINHGNAVEEMQKAGVDLLICRDAVNVQYLTNLRTTPGTLGMDGGAYATLKASLNRKPTFIGSQIQYYFDAPKKSVSDQLDFRFSGVPAEPDLFGLLTEASEIAYAPANQFYKPRIHDEAPLSKLEAQRVDQAFDAYTELSASLEAGIIAELLETDFPNKTIAIDSPALRPVIEKSGLDLNIVDGERLIRRIRMIKSPVEIEYMRFVAEANSRAAKTAARSVREGANFRDVRKEYAKACADQGTIAKFLMLDTHTAALAEGEIKDGRTFYMDCVSTFQEYHGDYGRTVCLGEPNRKMQQVVDGLSSTWDKVFQELKVGMSYLDIIKLTMKLYGETGVDVGYAVNPHNVGMHHHDEPNASEFSMNFKKDLSITLQEGMVISIDMPFLDIGLGGSAHLEDGVLITKDGPEFINDPSDRFIVV